MEVKLALELKIQTLSFQMIGCAMLCTPCVGGRGLWPPAQSPLPGLQGQGSERQMNSNNEMSDLALL